MIRALIRIILVALAILAVAVVIAITPAGLKIGLGIARLVIPGHLTYKKASGLLIGPITFTDLRYSNNSSSVSAKHLYIKYRLSSLFLRRLHISKLSGDDITVHLKQHTNNTQKTTSNQKPEFIVKKVEHWLENTQKQQQLQSMLQASHQALNQFEMPFGVVVSHATLRNIVIRNDTSPLVDATKLTLSVNAIGNKINLKADAEIQKPYISIEKLNMNGTFDHFTMKFTTRSHYLNAQVSALNTNNAFQLTVRGKQMQKGSINGKLRVNWQPKVHWLLNLNINQLQLKKLNTSWPNVSSVAIHSNGNFAKTPLDILLTTKIAIDNSHLNLSLKHNRIWHIRWDTNIQGIQHLLKNSYGTLISKGTLSGSLQHPVTSGSLQASQFRIGVFSTQKLNANWQINFKHTKPSSLAIAAQQLNIDHHHINKFSIKAAGTLQQQQIIINANSLQHKLNMVLDGSLKQQQWHLRLSRFLNQSPRYGQWRLAAPSQILLTTTQAKLSQLCLINPNNQRVCLHAQWQKNGIWQAQLQSKHLRSQLIADLINPTLRMSGQLQISVNISGTGSQLQKANADIQLSPGTIRFTADNKSINARYLQSNATLKFSGHGLHTNLKLNLANSDHLTANLSLPDYKGNGLPDQQQALRGTIRTNFQSLNVLSAFIPQLKISGGGLLANLTIGGRLNRPTVNGDLNLQNATAFVPALNLKLTQIRIGISARGDQLRYQANATTDKQQITISGNTNIKRNDFFSNFDVKGTNLLIADTSQFKLYASPNLHIALNGRSIDITGSLTIPKGNVSPHDFSGVVSMPNQEITYIGRSPTPRKHPWLINANVKVTIAPHVAIDTSGVKGILYGNLHIIKKARRPILGTGKISIKNGTYSTFGHTLTIDPSSYVQMTNSPLTNPNLNIRASRSVNVVSQGSLNQLNTEPYIVGVEVRGTFHEPTLTLFSVPGTLSQTDILSYLIFGQGGGSNAISNIGLLVRAMELMKFGSEGLGKRGNFIQDLQSSLGFNELGIETETSVDAIGNPINKQTSFVVGRHFSKYIYVRYSHGIDGYDWNNVNEVSIRFLLGKHWAIQATGTTSGSGHSLGNGADILYTIDK